MLLKKIRNKKGFTLIELIMVTVIVGILTAVSSMYIKETMDLWRFLSFRNEVVSVGRMALARMTREIRQIQEDIGGNAIYAAAASQLEFNNKDASDNDIRINYNLSGGNLMRNSDILASNVAALTFAYYDSANFQLAVPVADTTQIYRINIELEIESGGQTKTLMSQIYPRNF